MEREGRRSQGQAGAVRGTRRRGTKAKRPTQASVEVVVRGELAYITRGRCRGACSRTEWLARLGLRVRDRFTITAQISPSGPYRVHQTMFHRVTRASTPDGEWRDDRDSAMFCWLPDDFAGQRITLRVRPLGRHGSTTTEARSPQRARVPRRPR